MTPVLLFPFCKFWNEHCLFSVSERLENTLIDPDVPTDVKADLEVYIKRMRSKINVNMDVWHKKIKELEKDRKSLNESIWKL